MHKLILLRNEDGEDCVINKMMMVFDGVDDDVDEDDDDIDDDVDDDDADVTHCANQHICSWFFDSSQKQRLASQLLRHGIPWFTETTIIETWGEGDCLFVQSSSLTLKICCST